MALTMCMRPGNILIAFAVCSAWSQPADVRPEFDVASLKAVVLDGSDTYRANLLTLRNGVLSQTNVTLADCLRTAYGIPTEDQIVGPAWVKSKSVRFNIEAKAPPDTPRERELLMLQRLLENRFKLVLRREQRELSYLALIAAKSGPKMPVAKDPPKGDASHLGHHIHNDHIDMAMLAYLISRFTNNRVLDMTGLKGYFEVKLDWAPDHSMAPPRAGDTTPEERIEGASIFEAVQKQLGLKLEARKGPVEMLVVEQANQVPVEN